MIRETTIDRSLNRLQEHFAAHLVVRPPASAAEIAELEDLVGPLPRDLTIFLSTCNGLRVAVADGEEDHHLWPVREMISAIQTCPLGVPLGLLAVRGGATGPRDCVVMTGGVIHGAVLRWDPWGGPFEWVASAFGPYLDAWTHYLVETFASTGRRQHGRTMIAFDGRYAGRHDRALARLRADSHALEWVHEVELSLAGGADFE